MVKYRCPVQVLIMHFITVNFKFKCKETYYPQVIILYVQNTHKTFRVYCYINVNKIFGFEFTCIYYYQFNRGSAYSLLLLYTERNI